MIQQLASRLRRMTRFRIRSVAMLMLTAAIFCAGYRSGYRQSWAWKFQELIALIESTVVPSKWETLGPPVELAPVESVSRLYWPGMHVASEFLEENVIEE